MVLITATSASASAASAAALTGDLVNDAAIAGTTRGASTEFTTAWFDAASLVLRWEGTTWEEYRTLPQRALDGQRAFELFDSAGVYDYYAMLLGLVYAQFMVDTKFIATLCDPRKVPDSRLRTLATTLGVRMDSRQSLTELREAVRRSGPWRKSKGTADAVVQSLELLGYTGYATQVWVDPTVPAAVESGYTLRPLGWFGTVPDDIYVPSSGVAIHLLLRDGTAVFATSFEEQQRIARYLKENALPAHVFIRMFVSTEWDNVDPVTEYPDRVQVNDTELINDVDPLLHGPLLAAAAAASVALSGELNP